MGLYEIASLGGIIVGYLLAGVISDSVGSAVFLVLPLVYFVFQNSRQIVESKKLSGREITLHSFSNATREI